MSHTRFISERAFLWQAEPVPMVQLMIIIYYLLLFYLKWKIQFIGFHFGDHIFYVCQNFADTSNNIDDLQSN